MICNMSTAELKKKILPNFYGVIETVHYTPGRVRLKIEILKDSLKTKEYLEPFLEKINPIESYRINPVIGTLLIKFNENLIEPSILIGSIIKILNLEEEIKKDKVSKISEIMKGTIKTINHSIYNNTYGILDAKSMLSLGFLGLGIYQIKKKRVLPNGINLIWWAYNNTLGGKR
ncbi:HMA2 domain-containing protein [Psychrilyobacter sp.]|uniref:HMA2 domain-containing protein n=1 Tax=Psychrilyobacter sp. TaxID=2586924 RepID=UPI003015E2EE